MATLRPPSTSPSPSPAPGSGTGTPKTSMRASMGPSARPAPLSPVPPASPRPGGTRPTSELIGGTGMFQTPEADAIDQWFENLQNYEATLEEMAAASLDANFKDELGAIEQWFRVLSEAERTAALYSLLQQSTQVQIRFFITVLQQMAHSDPMTAILSPNAGGSMQSQMEAKLAQMGLKSPGIKPSVPQSPSARSFPTNNRQSLTMDSAGFLSPDSANITSGASDAANTLAQQRAKLKANHRISAPTLASTIGEGGRWPGNQLSQVAERTTDIGPTQELTVPAPSSASRPKSTDFSGFTASLKSPRLAEDDVQLSPMVGGNWASMVNTPMVPGFESNTGGGQNLDAAAAKLANWSNTNGRISLDDARKYRRTSKNESSNQTQNNTVYDDAGNPVGMNNGQQNQRNVSGGMRSASGANGNFFPGNNPAWAGARSPALSNVSSGRFGSDDGGLGGLNPGGFNVGMPSPGLGVNMAAGLASMGHLSPYNMLQMANLGVLTPEAQIVAAQLAAAGGFMPQGINGMAGMNPFGAMGMQQNMNNRNNRVPRSAGGKSNSGRDASSKDKDDEVDPALLNDVPAWLRSLRLHKYTPNFEGMNWKDMVVMDEAALEAKGVAALGARRKMLKTFEAVRGKMGIEMSAGAGSN